MSFKMAPCCADYDLLISPPPACLGEPSCSQPTVWPAAQQEGTNSSQYKLWFLDSGQNPYWSPGRTRRHKMAHETVQKSISGSALLIFWFDRYLQTNISIIIWKLLHKLSIHNILQNLTKKMYVCFFILINPKYYIVAAWRPFICSNCHHRQCGGDTYLHAPHVTLSLCCPHNSILDVGYWATEKSAVNHHHVINDCYFIPT